MKVAIVCDWLVVYAGAERVVEQILNIFPDADLSEINLDLAVFQFDHVSERVTLAYALSVEPLMRSASSKSMGKNLCATWSQKGQ